MSHRHLVTFLGLLLIGFGLVNGGWFLLAVWLGCDFLALGIAHGLRAPGVFGKRKDGSLPAWSWILFFPLLIYTGTVWHSVCSVASRQSIQFPTSWSWAGGWSR